MVRGSSPAETAVDAAGIAGAAAFPAVEGGPDLDSRGPARPVPPGVAGPGTGTPTMPSADAAPERSGRPRRLLGGAVAGLGALVAATLFAGLFDHGPPHRSARAEAVLMTTVSSTPSLYFHGPGDDLLDFAPAGQRRP